jgi:fructose-bisphosphate aldolase class II
MARIMLRQLLDHAAENDYGVPAFNINNMEQALAIVDAASAVDAPFVVQASRGARACANDMMLGHRNLSAYPCLRTNQGNEPAT